VVIIGTAVPGLPPRFTPLGETFAAGADRHNAGRPAHDDQHRRKFPGFPEGMDGYELMTRMQNQAERFGARVKFGTVEAVDLSKRPFTLTVDGEKVETQTIIIATAQAIGIWASRAKSCWRPKV